MKKLKRQCQHLFQTKIIQTTPITKKESVKLIMKKPIQSCDFDTHSLRSLTHKKSTQSVDFKVTEDLAIGLCLNAK